MATRTKQIDNNQEERGTGNQGSSKPGTADWAPTRQPKAKGFVSGRVLNIDDTDKPQTGNR